MSSKGKRPLRSMTPSGKIGAIQRIHDGESKASVARDIGVPESTLRGWCKNEEKLRFLARQIAEKEASDNLAEKMDNSSGMIGAPPEKRQKMDPSAPLNYSSKMKYEEMAYKRPPLNGLNYTPNNFNGLTPDYSAYDNTAKNKVFGTEISRQALAAATPLSSLSQLSGLGMPTPALGMNFNDLSFLAQFGGMNGLGATENTLRNIKPKTQPLTQSSRSESNDRDRQQGLSVKNWAKQKAPATSTLSDANYGLRLNDGRNKMKFPGSSLPTFPSLPSSLNNIQSLQPTHDDTFLNWFKSQQTLLGINNLYPAQPLPASTESPIRSSTPQQQNRPSNTPPIPSTSLSSASALPSSHEDKNALMLWYKMLQSAAVSHANTMHQQPPTSTTIEGSNFSSTTNEKPFENILYSHLTKDSGSLSMHSSSSIENIHHNNSSGKPEDLSTKSTKTISPPLSPLPTSSHSYTPSPAQSPIAKIPAHRRITSSEGDMGSPSHHRNGGSIADCKDVLDNLLYQINNNPGTAEGGSESDTSYASENNHCENNNNNHSNKTDEEERGKFSDHEDAKAIEHGEKFLKWLENCSNPRVTAVQLMVLRTLISAIKSGSEIKVNVGVKANNNHNNAIESITESDENIDESSRGKNRRRK